MTILYADQYVICDSESITINWYYFPLGTSKRIEYNQIRHIEEKELTLFQGKLRLWGMDLSPYWFHLDVSRYQKDKFIAIDDGEWIKSAITPEDRGRVLEILRDRNI